jgi:hypothetical protein
MQLGHSLVAREARRGMLVRVVEDKRRPEYEGKLGTIKGTFGHSDYPALDVQLENGRLELFWFHQLEKAAVESETRSLPFYDCS